MNDRMNAAAATAAVTGTGTGTGQMNVYGRGQMNVWTGTDGHKASMCVSKAKAEAKQACCFQKACMCDMCVRFVSSAAHISKEREMHAA